MIFAEASQNLGDPYHFASIGWVCVVLVCIIIGARQVIGIFRDLKDKPSGGDVRAESHQTFATKVDLDNSIEALETEDKALHSRIGAVDRDARKLVAEALQELRGNLSATSNTMHELKGEMKQLSIQLVNVQQELQNR